MAESIGPPLRALVWIIGLNMAVKVSGFGENEMVDSLADNAQRLGAIATFAWFLTRSSTAPKPRWSRRAD